MDTAELVLGLLAVVAVLVTVARRLGIAYPILLVLGGLALGLIPGIPRFTVDPAFIFNVVLPPILYGAAIFTPVRSLHANLGKIFSLAVGLVVASTIAVALTAHALIPDLPWAVAFVLGAIVAPPDEIAATAIATRLPFPRRLLSILEGESLLNDATALTLYSLGLFAVTSGTFSASTAFVNFVLYASGGALIGLAVAWVIAEIRRRIEDTSVQVTMSLLTGYAAFIPAQLLGVSGVIAAVIAGIYVGRNQSRILRSDTRLAARAVWDVLTFLLNGFVFLLTGLEVPLLLRELEPSQTLQLIAIGIVVAIVLVLVRGGWIFATTYGARVIRGRRMPAYAGAHLVVLSWAGMRGVVSLAVALALPASLPDGTAFPAREAVIVITLTVIVLTLVGQGLTLPRLIRVLQLGPDSEVHDEESSARQELNEAASRRIDELYPVWPGHHPLLDQLREQYRHRSEHVERQRDPDRNGEDRELIEHREIRRNVIDSERDALLRLRGRGAIDDDVLRKLEREIDLEEQRMDA